MIESRWLAPQNACSAQESKYCNPSYVLCKYGKNALGLEIPTLKSVEKVETFDNPDVGLSIRYEVDPPPGGGGGYDLKVRT